MLGTVNEVPEKKFPEIGSSVTKKSMGTLVDPIMIRGPGEGGFGAFGAIEFTIMSFALTLQS